MSKQRHIDAFEMLMKNINKGTYDYFLITDGLKDYFNCILKILKNEYDDDIDMEMDELYNFKFFPKRDLPKFNEDFKLTDEFNKMYI